MSAERLAEAIVSGIFAQPLAALMVPELSAPFLRELVLHHLKSPLAEETTRALLSALQKFFAERGDKTVRDLLPPEAQTLLRAIIDHPYTPERAILVSVMSREPFRRLNRELMTGTMLDYSRRLRGNVENGGMGKGLGMLGRFASEAVKKSTSALGTLAPGMTSAVGDELERQMQRRASEFADSAVDDMVQRVATTLTDPARAAEQLELKRALLDVALSLRGAQLSRELDRLQPAQLAKKLREATIAWLSRDTATAEIARGLSWIAAQPFAKPEFIAQALPESLRATFVKLLANALRPMVEDGSIGRALAE